MSKEYRKLRTVFSFTLHQHVKRAGYKRLTVLLALLFFLLPTLLMPLIETLSGEETSEEEAVLPAEFAVREVFVVDESPGEAVSWEALMDGIQYTAVESEEEALERSSASDMALTLLLQDDGDGGYRARLVLPEGSGLSEEEADAYGDWINQCFPQILMMKSGLGGEQILALYEQSAESETEDGDEETSQEDTVRQIFSIALPFLNIMLLYFLVLAYGQGVANSVVMEKTSKLMDTFLTALRPETMVFGKVAAIACAGMLQFLIWILALVLGFVSGTRAVLTINPDSQMALIQFFRFVAEEGAGLFSVPGIIAAVLMVFAGFLLYCSLAAISGALASKAEDLASTNVLFTMVLVLSFFCALYGGGMQGIGSTGASSAWLNWIPFTSILITPSRVLLGEVSLFGGCCSLLIVLAADVLLMLFAGRVYKMMALYSGKLPGLRQLVGMLKNTRR